MKAEEVTKILHPELRGKTMQTTMKSLSGPDTLQVLLVGFENGEKICEVDITDMSPREVGKEIELQEMQKRTWEYQIIKRYRFQDLGV